MLGVNLKKIKFLNILQYIRIKYNFYSLKIRFILLLLFIMSLKNKITVGLDLGTDKCCITYQDNIGRPFIITDDNSYKISSIIGLMNNGILVGNEISKNNMYDIPIISNLKRLIGRKADDKEVLQIASYFDWKIENKNDDLILLIENKSTNTIEKHSLNDLMCILLKKLKSIIILNIGDNFNVIITIPANFNEGQKNLILSYCKQVGIECKRLIYEPCSAALTYVNYFNSLEDIKNNETNNIYDSDNYLKRIMVFDFGAGTLDLAIVSCTYFKDDDSNTIEWMTKIESNIGDNNLGGLDIDIALEKYITSKYPALKKLLEVKNESIKFIVEKIKIKLSNMSKNTSLIEKYYDQIISINIDEYFDILNNNFKDRIILLLNSLHNEFINKTDIDEILLIGGSCYNPWINSLISNYYNKKINDYNLNISDHLKTYNLNIKDIAVSLGALCVDKKINKNGNTLIFTESLPLSIGIETVNNTMCKILSRNTLIPCYATQYFSTSEDNQTSIEIKLFQGERDNTNENFYLGSFSMDDLEKMPQGKIVVIINISVTTDGLISIEGKVKNTDKYNKKIIINKYDIELNDNVINKNVEQYEINDLIFSNIMKNYYELVTMLNRLQYNLLDNIIDIKDIIVNFWQDLLIVHNLMLQSDKIKNNISQLTKFINYINTKLSLDMTLNSYDILSNNNNAILAKLANLIKYIEKNLQHLITTYQIKVEAIVEAATGNTSEKKLHYNELYDVKLNNINSIDNSTELLDNKDKELLQTIKNEDNNINNKSINEIKELFVLLVDNIDTFEMPDINKILLLELIDKYEIYISMMELNNYSKYSEEIQNIILIISNIDNNEFIKNIYNDILNLNNDNINFINIFNKIIYNIVNYQYNR